MNKIFLIFIIVFFYSFGSYADMREDVLKNSIKKYTYYSSDGDDVKIILNEKKFSLGESLFKDKLLSFNSDTSCSTCHIDRFGSADGLKNSIGVGGHGEGVERLLSNGLIIPRNALPFWGRGEKDFKSFFWDGKVEQKDSQLMSQFGVLAPSDDPLTVAIHLPFVEIREMVLDNEFIENNFKNENVDSANSIYNELLDRVRQTEKYIQLFKEVYNVQEGQIEFIHLADAVRHFISIKFKLEETKLEKYLLDKIKLNQREIQGGIIFYGKGKCVSCHTGKHFSDFNYYSIPFIQDGFGKNGFGIDYGRYNVTQNPDDIYKFRTPPLTNVEKTSPYGHSGSAETMKDAIISHFDPLRLVNLDDLTDNERVEFYNKLLASNNRNKNVPYLNDDEVDNLIEFLKLLSF
jgi:cytochrome c peroxidase